MNLGHYKTVYADPPWNEAGGGECVRGAQRHYPLMKTDAICNLPVAMLAGANAHLYLWVTNNFLRDGFRVIDAWGFRYVTLITWAKDRIGLGQYFRGMTEHCIFAVRGSLPYRSIGEKRAQGTTLIKAPKREHSRKPDEMRAAIEIVSYPPPRRAVCARRTRRLGSLGERSRNATHDRRTDADIQEVFRKIAARERLHGDFLTCFAEAYTRADFANKPLLRDAALQLIEKYKLAGYATEPAITTFPPDR